MEKQLKNTENNIIDEFVSRFSGLTQEYVFYGGEVVLRYDPKDHVYLLANPETGELEVVNGVTNTCSIIDKSNILMRWAVKMMAQKLVNTATPFYNLGTDTYSFKPDELEKWIKDSKSAHKDEVEKAGDTGSISHEWIERHIKFRIDNELNDIPHIPMYSSPEDERAANCCTAALDWMNKHNVRWIYTERKIYHRDYKYAGTMDGLCRVDSCNDPSCCPNEFKDRLSLIDWKSSNFLHTEYLMQTAAYQAAYMDETKEPVKDRWIIRLGKEDAKFDPWHLGEETFEDDFKAFLSALDLVRAFDKIENRISQIKDYRRIIKKEQKEQSLMIKCKNANSYKGVRKPTCNSGNPCESCLNKYSQTQEAKQVKKELKKKTPNKKLSQEEVVKSLENLLTSK